MKKRMLSVFLTLCMILTLLPTALAVDEPENPVDSASLTEVEAAEETTTEQEPDSAGAEELEKTEMSSSIQNQTLTVGEEYDFTVTTTVGSDVG